MAFALIVTIVTPCFVFTASAEATYNVASFDDLKAKLEAATDGDVINITSNIEVTETLNITTDITINGGSSTISYAGADTAFMLSGGQVTVSGGIFTVTGTGAMFTLNGAEAASMVITGGYFEGNNSDNETNLISVKGANDVLNVYGGLFVQEGDGVAIGPDCSDEAHAHGTANIYGGTFYTTTTAVIASISRGAVNLYGGNFSSRNANPVAGTEQTGAVLNYTSALNSGLVTGTNQITAPDGYTYYTSEINGGTASFIGGSVRTTEDSGLRFTNEISATTIASIKQIAGAEAEIRFGTLICPKDYLVGLPAFTKEALDIAGKTYLDIPAVNGIEGDEANGVRIHAAMLNIKEGNYSRAFASIAYIQYEVDGKTVTVYGVYDTANERSVKSAATAALMDTQDTYDELLYPYISKYDGKFSPYSEDQQKVINSYCQLISESEFD